MSDETKDCAAEDKRREERRVFARASFFFMLVFAGSITLALLFHPDRLDLANSLDKTSSILNGIMVSFAAIIMSYLGMSTWEAVAANKESHRNPPSPSFKSPPPLPVPEVPYDASLQGPAPPEDWARPQRQADFFPEM